MSETERSRRNVWRERCEQWLDSDMSVAEWCSANRLGESAMFRWFGRFADTEPELFGGADNIADRESNRWLVKTRENMRASKSLALKGPSGFVRIGEVEEVPDMAAIAALAGDGAGRMRHGRPPRLAPPPIRVSIGCASVEIPPSSSQPDIERVLRAVAAL